MPFMLTYAAVDYAYFTLAMSFDWRRKHPSQYLHDGIDSDVNYGTVDGRTGLFGSSSGADDNAAAVNQTLSDKEIDVSESTRMVQDSDGSAVHKSCKENFICFMRSFCASCTSFDWFCLTGRAWQSCFVPYNVTTFVWNIN